jgi:glycosidase
MNVILDYVANHVHQEHPVYQQHPEWATNLYLPDSTLNTMKWDEYRLTTWFDTFMPTLDLRRDEVVEAMTDSALYWFENFQLDGFRHDATKHIPLKFWRSLTRKLKYRVATPEDRTIYQIGETYGNPQLIGSYIGSGLLDAQFDFNLYDASVSAFAKEDGSIENLQRVLDQSLTAYGYHHLMGNISGNQDRTRFISYADGSVSFSEDPKLAGWTREITIGDTIGYSRLAMLHAFNFTIPGVPVIYYGDEIGLPGANDPDNRRMMRFGDELDSHEKALLTKVKKIARLRQDNMALLYGDLFSLSANDGHLAYLRNYFDQTALVFINTTRKPKEIIVQVPKQFNLEKLKANFGNDFEIYGRELNISLEPASFEIITN